MNRDRLDLIATALGILAILFAVILLPPLRSILLGSLIIAACWLLAIVIAAVVLLYRFTRAIGGPKSLSGTRCPNCRKRNAIREIKRAFLHGNVKFNFDHYHVVYQCIACGYQQEQEEHVDLKP